MLTIEDECYECSSRNTKINENELHCLDCYSIFVYGN